MKRLFRYVFALICFSVTLAPSGIEAQKKKTVVVSKTQPMSARFVVKATYEENYLATKNASLETLNHDSKLKIEFQASRWLLMTKNEAGNVEFENMTGGQPATASGDVLYEAIFDSKSGTDKIHAEKIFNGEITADMLSLSMPRTSELGEGFGFDIEFHNRLRGICKATLTKGTGTQSLNDCSDPAGLTVGGFEEYGENEFVRTTEMPNAVNYNFRFELLPGLFDIAKLKLSANDTLGTQRLARLEAAHQQKNDSFSSYRWFGAATTGSSSLGYKITFTGTKNHPANGATEGGGKQEWTQKLTITAEIIPSAPNASIDSLIDSPTVYIP
jgi:hypothetical protein